MFSTVVYWRLCWQVWRRERRRRQRCSFSPASTLMSLPDDEPVLSREGSALLPETPSAVPDAPTISPLIAHLSNFLTDCHLDLLARLENRLARVGITTVRQLGALRESVDGEPDPVARELFSDIWKQVLDSFKSQQRLQRAQFVQAANAARQNGLAVGLAPSAPPVAPLPSPPEPHQQQELPPTALSKSL